MLGYDIKINAKETKFYNFLDKDNLTLDNILMFKVSYQMFLTVLEYEGHISDEVYNLIKDNKYLLLTDTKSNIVLKVNEDRKVTNLYYLDIRSDLDILELSYNLPKLDKFFKKDKLRVMKSVNSSNKKQNFIKKVITNITNLDKLNYILCELELKKAHTVKEAQNTLLNNKDYTKLYDILKGLND